MAAAAAARVGDPFGHSSAMSGVVIGLAVGALIETAILTGGVSLIAVGAAVAITGSAGLAGEAIGQTMDGPDTGVIATGSMNVRMNGRAAAMTVIATGGCSRDSGPPMKVATGAATVFINGQPAARVGEKMSCSAVIRHGSANVFIGGPAKAAITPAPEVPGWLDGTMLAMVVGGTAIGTYGVAATYGIGAAIGSLVGGTGGSYALGHGASGAAAAMGYGATGQAIAGVAGGAIGGALFGGAGFKAAARPQLGEVATPWGPALQSVSPDALAMRPSVENGATLYRMGTIGRSEGAEAQFWALEHPLSPGYAGRYGIPPENVAKFDFVEAATLKPGTPFVTRPAPGIGTNPGGGIEVVTPKNGVNMIYFGGYEP